MISKLKQLLISILAYILCLIISTFVFIELFHINYLKVTNVFFYNGLFFLLITSILCSLLMLIIKRVSKNLVTIHDVITVFFLYSGFTLGWFVLIPVTVERSISVYMLSCLEQNGKVPMTKKDFEDRFYKQYIVDFGAFDKRFKEQLDTESIEYIPSENAYRITDKGRNIVKLFRISANLFGTEDKIVYPNQFLK